MKRTLVVMVAVLALSVYGCCGEDVIIGNQIEEDEVMDDQTTPSDGQAYNSGSANDCCAMNRPVSAIRGQSHLRWLDENRDNLLSDDEFLRIVSENEDILGMTVADFDGIDIQDFLIDRFISWESLEHGIDRFIPHMGGRSLRDSFESYLRNLSYRRVSAFLALELRTEESTDEEFELFKADFFERLGGEVSSHYDRFNTVRILESASEEFIFDDGENPRLLTIGRTMYIERLKQENGWKVSENPVFVTLSFGDDTGWEEGMHISRCGKFFLLSVFDSEHIVTTFLDVDC